MAPGPKPKSTPKRQTLGVAVQPWTLETLDKLLESFARLEPFLPGWFARPNTRSSAAAWVLERCINNERKKVSAIVVEYYKRLDERTVGLSEDEKQKLEKLEIDISEFIGNDSFLQSLRNALQENLGNVMKSRKNK